MDKLNINIIIEQENVIRNIIKKITDKQLSIILISKLSTFIQHKHQYTNKWKYHFTTWYHYIQEAKKNEETYNLAYYQEMLKDTNFIPYRQILTMKEVYNHITNFLLDIDKEYQRNITLIYKGIYDLFQECIELLKFIESNVTTITGWIFRQKESYIFNHEIQILQSIQIDLTSQYSILVRNMDNIQNIYSEFYSFESLQLILSLFHKLSL